jgi:4'-phosphopantetheinyl transferase EntD
MLESSANEPRLAAVAAWLRHHLPPGFALACAPAGEQWPVPSADRVHVARSLPARRAEFVAGRWCAHTALRNIGLPAASLPPGPLRAPKWPDGALGSITHEQGLCVAVAGRAGRCLGIGIDLCDTSRQQRFQGLEASVLAAGEPLPPGGLPQAFGAKEAVIKAVSRSVGHFLDLRDIVIRWRRGQDIFEAEVTGLPRLVRGRRARIEGLEVSLAVLNGRTVDSAETAL